VVTAAAFRRPAWQWQPLVQFAGAAALLLIGIGFGRFLPASQPQPNPDIALLREELRDTRQMVTLSLLQQQSASERLKGVNTSSQLEQPGTEVVSALLDTLRRDPNVNVRLATVDALRRFGSREVVRKSVVDALPQQQSPLVQIAMVDFILETAGPEARAVLQRLAEDMMLNQAVRARAARGLQQVGL
jgi:hypothetical protein